MRIQKKLPEEVVKASTITTFKNTWTGAWTGAWFAVIWAWCWQVGLACLCDSDHMDELGQRICFHAV